MANLTRDDIVNIGKRAVYEAAHGALVESMERLKEAIKQRAEEQDAEGTGILYENLGRLYRDQVGSATDARRAFEDAIQADSENLNAVSGLIGLAQQEEDFEKWVHFLDNLRAPQHTEFLNELDERIKMILSGLDEGLELGEILQMRGEATYSRHEYGHAAALFDAAIGSGHLDNLYICRRLRAYALRELDSAQTGAKTGINPPGNRLPLKASLAEWDEILKTRPHDAEAWNAKSAYHNLLFEPVQAVAAAEAAIRVQPDGYVKPNLNIARACEQCLNPRIQSYLKERIEGDDDSIYIRGLEHAQKGLANAENMDDKELAESLIKELESYRISSPSVSDDILQDVIHLLLVKSKEKAFNEAASQGGTVDQVVHGARRRYPLDRYRNAKKYIPFIEELLMDFSPDYCYQVFVGLGHIEDRHLPNSLKACMYIADGEPSASQRDATRVLSLFVLTPGTPSTAGQCFNHAILRYARDQLQLANLQERIIEDIRSLNADIAKAVEQQANSQYEQTPPEQNSVSQENPFFSMFDDNRADSQLGFARFFVLIILAILLGYVIKIYVLK